jgi:hypothetical protein
MIENRSHAMPVIRNSHQTRDASSIVRCSDADRGAATSLTGASSQSSSSQKSVTPPTDLDCVFRPA